MLDVVRSLLMKTLTTRDYGSQEVSHLSLGLPLTMCSREFVKVNLSGDREMVADEGIRMNKVDVYCNRPNSYESVTLFEFYQRHRISGKNITKRKKGHNAIVQCFPYLPNNPKHPQYEKFCMYELMKTVPFRCLDDLRGDHSNFCDSYCETLKGVEEDEPALKKAKLELFGQSVAEATELLPEEEYGNLDEFDQDVIRETEDWMLLCDPSHKYPEINSENVDWMANRDSYNIGESIQFIDQNKALKPCVQETLQYDPSLLNDSQARVYSRICDAFADPDNPPIVPVRMICSGTAGTGKSFLIHCIKQFLGNRCLVMAPTGKAAHQINGKTCHSVLQLPVKSVQVEINSLKGGRLNQLQERLSPVQLIIIDEISMIGGTMFGEIASRLSEAFLEHKDEVLGGCSMLLLGDFGQLPPVADTPLYQTAVKSAMNNKGRLIYQEFKEAVVLQTVMRQADDQFRGILARMRNAEVTGSDIDILKSRSYGLNLTDVKKFNDATRLYTTRSLVAQENARFLSLTGEKIIRINAEHTGDPRASKVDPREAGGLLPELHLSKGARVMLTSNIWQDAGLCNGVIGTVVDTVFAEKGPPNLPAFVMCRFPDYCGPSFSESDPKVVPITPVTRTFHVGQTPCHRTQLPLQLSWCITVHKAQGLTLDCVVINLETSEFAAGLTFVAMSRVRKLSDLLIENFDERRFRMTRKKSLGMIKRIAEDRRLLQLDGQGQFHPNYVSDQIPMMPCDSSSPAPSACASNSCAGDCDSDFGSEQFDLDLQLSSFYDDTSYCDNQHDQAQMSNDAEHFLNVDSRMKRFSHFEKVGRHGLPSDGNTCFMNSVLQCLATIQPFVDDIRAWKNSLVSPLVSSLEVFFRYLTCNREPSTVFFEDFKSQFVARCPAFGDGQEHDADEFFTKLLITMHNDLNSAIPQLICVQIDDFKSIASNYIREAWTGYRDENNGPITDFFTGQSAIVTSCIGCDYRSVKFETFRSFVVPVKIGTSKLQECLNDYVKPELLDRICECSSVKAKRETVITKLPNIFVIRLQNRFEEDLPSDSRKIQLQLCDVDLSLHDLTDDRIENRHFKYDLAALVHFRGGFERNAGNHYNSYCKSGTSWLCCDREIRCVQVDKVKRIEDPYLLFLQRQNK